MAESIEHKQLVLKAKDWILENLIDESKYFIFTDIDRRINYDRPIRVLNGYQPDIVCKGHKSSELIIVEAKTISDIDNEHSIYQYRSYYKTCDINSGRCYLIFSVPFTYGPRIKNVLKNNNIIKTDKIEIIVLEF